MCWLDHPVTSSVSTQLLRQQSPPLSTHPSSRNSRLACAAKTTSTVGLLWPNNTTGYHRDTTSGMLAASRTQANKCFAARLCLCTCRPPEVASPQLQLPVGRRPVMQTYIPITRSDRVALCPLFLETTKRISAMRAEPLQLLLLLHTAA
jgi:hypothetical protein